MGKPSYAKLKASCTSVDVVKLVRRLAIHNMPNNLLKLLHEEAMQFDDTSTRLMAAKKVVVHGQPAFIDLFIDTLSLPVVLNSTAWLELMRTVIEQRPIRIEQVFRRGEAKLRETQSLFLVLAAHAVEHGKPMAFEPLVEMGHKELDDHAWRLLEETAERFSTGMREAVQKAREKHTVKTGKAA